MIRKIYVQISNLYQLDLKEKIIDSINSLDGVTRIENIIKGHRLWMMIDTDKISEKELVLMIKNLGGHVAKVHHAPMLYTHQRLLQWLSFVGVFYFFMAYFLGFLMSVSTVPKLVIFTIFTIAFLSLQAIFWHYTRSLSPQILHIPDLNATFKNLRYLFIFTCLQLLVALLDATSLGREYMWFLIALSVAGWVFSLQSLFYYQKNTNLLQKSLYKTSRNVETQYVNVNNKKIPASAILEDDIFESLPGSILPVDAQLLTDSLELVSLSGSIKKRYSKDEILFAGLRIGDDTAIMKARSRVETSLLAQQIIFSQKESNQVSNKQITSKQLSLKFIGIFFILAVVLVWLGLSFLSPLKWNQSTWQVVIFVWLFLSILYHNPWHLWLKAFYLGWFMKRLNAMGALYINLDTAKRFSMAESIVVHQELFPLVMNYDNPTIVQSQIPTTDVHDIWQCYAKAVKIHRNVASELVINGRNYTIFSEHDSLVHHGDNIAIQSIIRDLARPHQTLFFICQKQEVLAHILVPHALHDDLVFLVDKILKLGMRPILFSQLSQGVINDLARDIGVLEAYGSCSALKSMDILDEFTKKGQSVVYVGQKEWDIDFVKKGQHFLLASVDTTKTFQEKSDLILHDFSAKTIVDSLLTMNLFSQVHYRKRLYMTFWIMFFVVLSTGLLSHLLVDNIMNHNGNPLSLFLSIVTLGYSIFFVNLAMNNLKIMIKYSRWLKTLTIEKKSVKNRRHHEV